MKREVIVKRKAAEKFEAPDDAIFHNRPLLAEALCDPVYEDGNPRDVWGLSLNWCGQTVTASVNHKEERRSFNTSASTVEEALDALETLLGQSPLPWRYWGKQKRS